MIASKRSCLKLQLYNFQLVTQTNHSPTLVVIMEELLAG